MRDGFDRFADAVARMVAHPACFAFCLGIVVAWLIQGAIGNLWTNDLFHLELNSPTTALTFLLVALLHNTQHRFESATNERLHHLEESIGDGDPVDDPGQRP